MIKSNIRKVPDGVVRSAVVGGEIFHPLLAVPHSSSAPLVQNRYILTTYSLFIRRISHVTERPWYPVGHGREHVYDVAGSEGDTRYVEAGSSRGSPMQFLTPPTPYARDGEPMARDTIFWARHRTKRLAF
ncbi:hypothetical protein TNCV_3868751 [Trichonephila clavipes]|nr:hypothetical protein TNCV_3868751 [Trichonephila clavipes]